MAKPKEIPNIDVLNEMLDLCNNKLYWKSRDRKYFNSDKQFKMFETMFAGKMCRDKLAAGERYLKIRLLGKIYPQHRIIFSMHLGRSITPDEIVDHVNGNTLDNSKENLLLSSYTKNARNRKLNANNTSGKSGVYFLINDDGSMFYRAQWWDGKKRRNKSFSLSKYGDLAYQMAVDYIKQQRSKLEDYSERHGK